MIKSKKTLENLEYYPIDQYYENWELKLDSNENAYGASPCVKNAVHNFSADKIRRYPAYGELIDILSKSINCNKNNLVLTNGCDEAINVFFNTYLEYDDEVLSFSPTFSMPELYSGIIGAKFIKIKYDKKWEFSKEKFEKNITSKTKILYFTTPNNPTGNIINKDDIVYFAKKYREKIIFLDLTYFNYSTQNKAEFFELPKKFENIVIAKSLSKDHALAGLRLGYLYANENMINEVKKVISPYSVNSCAVFAGIAALSDKNYFEEIKLKLNNSKKLLAKELNEMGYKAVATEANFVLCDFGKFADFTYNNLIKNGIKVKYFKNTDGLQNTFRITSPKLEDIPKITGAIEDKPLFVFDLDGVVFDVQNSYREAIKQTFSYFTGKNCTDCDIQNAKNLGGLSNDWDLTEYLIKQAGKNVKYDDLVNVFQNLFYIKGKGGLIDNEDNILDENFFKELSNFVNCAVFTGRPTEEAFYSLEKYNIKKYFSYFICNEDVEGNHKPSPFGLNIIKENTRYTNICYFGDTVDDIQAGCEAKIETYGIIPPKAASITETEKELLKKGARKVIKNKNDILELAKNQKGILCK